MRRGKQHLFHGIASITEPEDEAANTGPTPIARTFRGPNPHNPHPPPKSLALTRPPPVLLSSTLPPETVLSHLQDRLAHHKTIQEEHQKLAEETKLEIAAQSALVSGELDDCRNRRSRPTSGLANQTSESFYIGRRPQQVSANRSRSAEKLARVEELKAKLEALRKQRVEEQEAWEKRRLPMLAEIDSLKEKVAEEVLLESHVVQLYHATRKYQQAYASRKTDKRRQATLEESLMHRHDDVVMAEVHRHNDVPKGESTAVLFLSFCPDIEGLWLSDRKSAFKELHCQRLAVEERAKGFGGYMSQADGNEVMIVFPSVVRAVLFAVSFREYEQLALHEDKSYILHGPVVLEKNIPNSTDISIGIAVQRAFDEPLLHFFNFVTVRRTYLGWCIPCAARACEAAPRGEIFLTAEAKDVFTEVTKEDNKKVAMTRREVDGVLYFAASLCASDSEAGDSSVDSETERITATPASSRRTSAAPKPLRPWWAVGVPSKKWSASAIIRSRKAKWRVLDSTPPETQRYLEALERHLMEANDLMPLGLPPTGQVTVAFADVDGYEDLAKRLPSAASEALMMYSHTVRKLLVKWKGYEVKCSKATFMLAFPDVQQALMWSMELQSSLLDLPWPIDLLEQCETEEVGEVDNISQEYVTLFCGLRVKVGFNTGEPECALDHTTGRFDYSGPSVKLAARLCQVANGGETVIGTATFNQLQRLEPHPRGVAIQSSGTHRLKGVAKPESLFSVVPTVLNLRRPHWKGVEDPDITEGVPDVFDEMLDQSRRVKRRSRKGMPEAQVRRLLLLESKLPSLKKRINRLIGVLETQELMEMEMHDTVNVANPPTVYPITIIFTEIQHSTHLWDVLPNAMRETIAIHNAVLRRVGRACQAYEVKTEGDAFMMAFAHAEHAGRFCVEAQLALLQENWPQTILDHPACKSIYHPETGALLFSGPRVRMGFNAGEPSCEPDPVTGRMDYFGPMVNMSARVSGQGKHGEIVMGSAAWAQLEGWSKDNNMVVRYKGDIPLKGIAVPEPIRAILPPALEGRWLIWETQELYEPPANTAAASSPNYSNLAKTRMDSTLTRAMKAHVQTEDEKEHPPPAVDELDAIMYNVVQRLCALEATLADSKQLAKVRTVRNIFREMHMISRFIGMLFKSLISVKDASPGKQIERKDIASSLESTFQELCSEDTLFASRIRLDENETKIKSLNYDRELSWVPRTPSEASVRESDAVSEKTDTMSEPPLERPASAKVHSPSPERPSSKGSQSGHRSPPPVMTDKQEKEAKRVVQEFVAIDASSTGSIYINELKGAKGKALLALLNPTNEPVDKVCKRLDRNRDGIISITEVLRVVLPDVRLGDILDWLDKTGDSLGIPRRRAQGRRRTAMIN